MRAKPILLFFPALALQACLISGESAPEKTQSPGKTHQLTLYNDNDTLEAYATVTNLDDTSILYQETVPPQHHSKTISLRSGTHYEIEFVTRVWGHAAFGGDGWFVTGVDEKRQYTDADSAVQVMRIRGEDVEETPPAIPSIGPTDS